MADEVQLLAGTRQPGETRRAILACNDYLRMGSGRSLQKLLDRYQDDNKSPENKPPSHRLKTLADWSRNFSWKSRCSEYDAALDREKNERRRAIMESGLSLDHERVTLLKDLALTLNHLVKSEILPPKDESEELPKTKDARRLGVLVAQLRGTLEDLAQETGGRKIRTEVTNIAPITLVEVVRSSDKPG